MTTEPTANTTATPLDGLLEQYRAELEGLNYSRWTVETSLRVIRELGHLMDVHGAVLADLTPDRAADLIGHSVRRSSCKTSSAFMARRFATHLVTLGLAKPPPAAPHELARAALRRDYEDYLRRQRGLSERTIRDCWRFAERFLAFRFGQAEVVLNAITPADIAAFLQRPTSHKVPHRGKTPPTHLRNFFQFLFKGALTPSNLALCVPRVAQRYSARLPRHLAPEQVEALLATVRTEGPHARRDYAMVLLLARLGLRAPEVVAMQIDDVDWRAGELMVRGKGNNHDRVPIPPDVGEALADYIRQDRASTSRALFVAGRAPHRAFKASQVLNRILKAAFDRTGISPPCRYVGSHVLRHSLATNLVRQGASLAEVGDMLRHRSRASTLIYAKLDIDGLRSVAQPWPAAGGVR